MVKIIIKKKLLGEQQFKLNSDINSLVIYPIENPLRTPIFLTDESRAFGIIK